MIYLMDEPFEAEFTGDRGHVVAYRCDGVFLFVRPNGRTSWAAAVWFTPPPPIPAAARKPKVGEVWMRSHWAAPALLIYYDGRSPGNWATLTAEGALGTCIDDWLTRPATPEEAEPFRPLLEGLKASLGEE